LLDTHQHQHKPADSHIHHKDNMAPQVLNHNSTELPLLDSMVPPPLDSTVLLHQVNMAPRVLHNTHHNKVSMVLLPLVSMDNLECNNHQWANPECNNHLWVNSMVLPLVDNIVNQECNSHQWANKVSMVLLPLVSMALPLLVNMVNNL
jgi:hypothetical protein